METETKSVEEKPVEVEKAAEAEKPLVVDEEMMDEDEVKSVESA